ncbi:hypothetical protein BH10BAC5_BH10BAC5_15570 [soil metagenome]
MSQKKKILFIGGSKNQTTMMIRISEQLSEYECYFSAYYGDGFVEILRKLKIIEHTVLGYKSRFQTEELLKKRELQIDYRGEKNNYDYVFTSSDLVIPNNIKSKKVILVQEGMTDPDSVAYYIVRYLKLYRYLASTSMTGLSHAYDLFCVASDGYKEYFVKRGCDPDKLVVTGIPNFDNCKESYNNNFPYKNYVLVCTSDIRETFRYENRKKFILKALKIAGDKLLIFKLHPNEKVERATEEINQYAPNALVYAAGNTNEMIANCDILITKYSTVVYVGLALGKESYSFFDIDRLKKMTPIQNGGKSAENIANAFRHRIANENFLTDNQAISGNILKTASVL